MPSPRSLFLWTIAPVLLAPLGFLPFVEVIDLQAMDAFRRGHAPHPDIAIIAIDNASLQRLGRWPWSRTIHAELLRALERHSPRAVGFDVMFAEPESNDADGSLALSMREAEFPIILPIEEIRHTGRSEPEILLPLAAFRELPTVALGHVSIPASSDGIARFTPAPLRAAGRDHPSFGVQMALALGAAPPDPRRSFIDYAGPAGTFPTFRYADVLDGGVPPAALAEKILLIGATASDLHDTVLAPLSPPVLSGVEWQANVLSSALLRSSLALPARSLVVLGGVLITLALLLLFHVVSIRTSFIMTIAVLILLPLASWYAWQRGWALPYLFASLLVLLGFLSNAFRRWYVAEHEKRTLKRAIKSYFSPSVLDSILRNPASLKLGGERREITPLFSDVRNFTTITESTDPIVLTKLMYEYFTAMTEEVFATDGVVCQFSGDGLYAFWGAPLAQADHTQRAVRSAINMMRRLLALRRGWAERGLPFINIGIGINTGIATVGNMGSEKRFDYTATGDCVNAASRLESLNKEHKTNIIISQSVEERLPPDIERRFLADVLVKGKTVPLRIFEVTERNWTTG